MVRPANTFGAVCSVSRDGRVFAGLVVNDFNRNTTIGRNSFRKLGDSAILLIGSAELLDATGGDYTATSP